MKIDRIEIYRVGMPLVYLFRTVAGNFARRRRLRGAAQSGSTQGPDAGKCGEMARQMIDIIDERVASMNERKHWW